MSACVSSKLFRCAIVLLGFLACSPALGQQYPLKCELALVNSTVIPGEPIILKYKITNVSQSVFLPYKVDSAKEWLRFQIVDSDGRMAPSVPDHSLVIWEFSRLITKDQYFQPNKTYQGFHVLTQWQQITHSGKYKIKIHIDLPYDMPLPDGIHPGDLAYSGDHVLKINVKPGSTYRLEKITQEWLKKAWIKDYTNYKSEDQKLAIKALFSIPEGTALPYWKQMILHVDDFRDSGEQEIHNQLSRLGTPNAQKLQSIALKVVSKGKTPPVQPANQVSGK